MWIKVRSGGGAGNFRGGGGMGSAMLASQTAGDPRLSSVEVKIKDINSLTPALQQMRNILLSTHKGIEDFTFRTQEDWAENIAVFIKNARLSGGMIAAISLLVGGIGIMNIMLASISERVREIGIRKSVGATTADVFVQILVESVVLAVLGGLAGLGVSFLLVQGLASLSPTDNTPVITFAAMTMAFAASVAIGIVAGLVPAFKASGLHPIQALRYD
jgi:putative ABC transport system permease protein